jgi:two-component system, NarL family, nitrate/nitrite response regulator NarL
VAGATILLAIEEGLFRAGLRIALEREPHFDVIGEAPDAESAVLLASELSPDVLILDMEIPGARDPNIVHSLCGQHLSWRSLVLTLQEDTGAIADAFRAGAAGVAHKGMGIAALIQGIRSVLTGARWAGGTSAGAPSAGKQGSRTGSNNYQLTMREMEIVSAIVAGYANREIAEKLSISEDTVKHHLTHIFDKVGAYNRLELALFAIHHGLVGK